MGDGLPDGSLVRFGVFEVDLRTGELRKQGVRIRLQEQPFRILQILLERPGELVTREELQNRIWPGTFVDADHGLYNGIKKLREALNDESDTPRLIETLPKRGYRFIGSVTRNGTASRIAQTETDNEIPASSSLVRRRWLIATLAGILPLGALLVIGVSKRTDRTSDLRLTHSATSNAQQDLLEGRYHADRAYEEIVFKSGDTKKSEEEFAKGVFLIERSIQKDPNYVPAYLALTRAVMSEPPHVDLAPKARSALIKALSLDEANPETHLLMASFLCWNIEGGWDDPKNHYLRAIELRPDSAQGHEAYAEYLDDQGQLEAGMKEHQRAQGLDPYNDYLTLSPLTSRAQQLERKRKWIRVNGSGGYDYWQLGGLEFEAGQFSDALKDWTALARQYGWDEEATAWEMAYARGGSQALIAEVVRVGDRIASERYFPRDMIIDAHRYAGDRDGTLAWLAIARKEHNPVILHLRSDVRWDPYRSDPRFQAIARQVGLP